MVPYINLEKEILRLKKELNAVILAHYYQDSEIQDIADFVGDALTLSRKAATSSADVIVSCGVKFMAETAFILNPEKKILIPDLAAGCSLEDSCPAGKFKEFRNKYADHIAITYINCSAEVKALSDIIVTSSNAEAIISSLPEDKPILFAPDRHFGNFLMKKTGRKMKLWPGSCVVHESFSERELIKLRTTYPKAKVIAHPECTDSLLQYAEYVGSPAAMLEYIKQYNGSEFIVLTEPGIIHQMKKICPQSKFYDVPTLSTAGSRGGCSTCHFMKMNNLEKLYQCMKNQSPEITVPKKIADQARVALEKMLEFPISLR